jgi:HSP20 family protein
MSIIPKDFFGSRPVQWKEDPWTSQYRSLNKMMDELLHLPTEAGKIGAFVPPVTLTDRGRDFLLTTELPGMDANDIHIQLENNSLIIKGEKKNEHETQDGHHYRFERSYGSFARSIAFPSKVNPEKVEANFKNGVLQVTVNKADETIKDTRKITIKT